MEIKSYGGKYPTAANQLIEEGKSYKPKQALQTWGTSGDRIVITYKLKGMGPASFEEFRDTLLFLAYQEAMRYNEYRWKYARFDVKLGAIKKFAKDIPETASFSAASSSDPEVMVWGPGYEVEDPKDLSKKAADILDIAKRYRGKLRGGKLTFRVTQLVINIKDVI